MDRWRLGIYGVRTARRSSRHYIRLFLRGRGKYDGAVFRWRHQLRRDPYAGERNSFLFSMLVMASYIIRADGKIMHSEMEYVRQFLRRNFGEIAVSQGEEILLKLFDQAKRMDQENNIPVQSAGKQNRNAGLSARLRV